MPFCTQCGTLLEPEKKFCTSCGLPILHASSQAPTTIEGKERVLGVIAGLEYQRSFLKMDLINLVITNNQMLCVPVNNLVQKGINQADADARAQNKGFFGRYKAKMNVVWATNFSSHFLAMTPEAILLETPETITIPLSEVNSFTLEHSLKVSGEDDECTTESWNIHIKTKTGLHTFLSRSDPSSQIEGNPAIFAVVGSLLRRV